MSNISPFDNNGVQNAALAEAYASAPLDRIPLYALEVNHRTFTQPARVVRWPITGNEPERFYLKLEDDAPYDPGQVVEFIGAPFEISPPDNSSDGFGTFRFSIDGVGDSLDINLENAALGGGKIEVIIREYLKEHPNDGPYAIWDGLEMKSPKFEGATLKATGVVLSWVVMGYGTKYRPEQYPGLVRGR